MVIAIISSLTHIYICSCQIPPSQSTWAHLHRSWVWSPYAGSTNARFAKRHSPSHHLRSSNTRGLTLKRNPGSPTEHQVMLSGVLRVRIVLSHKICLIEAWSLYAGSMNARSTMRHFSSCGPSQQTQAGSCQREVREAILNIQLESLDICITVSCLATMESGTILVIIIITGSRAWGSSRWHAHTLFSDGFLCISKDFNS